MTAVLTSLSVTVAPRSMSSGRIAELLDQQEQGEQPCRSDQRDEADDERPLEDAESQHRG
jgi:hypothetical protein